MAQSGYTPIQIYHSDTPAAVPNASNLIDGELAINIADGTLFYKNSVTNNVTQLTGLSGASGFSGRSGFSGATGASGFSGATGASGFSGATGASGFSGANGASGFSGFSGINGIAQSGASGFSGISGFSGASGTSGFSGFSGINGIAQSGASGFSGISGFSGFSGATGPTVYPGAGIPLSSGSAWSTSFNDTSNPVSVPYGGTGLTSLTVGRLLYGAGTSAFGNSSDLFWDSVNDYLGIGTSSPVANVFIRGGNSNTLALDNSGQQYTTMSWYNNGNAKVQAYWDQVNGLAVYGTVVSAPLVFIGNGTESMRIHATQGVSIGTSTDPGATNLLVNGSVGIGSNFKIIQESGVLNFYNGVTKIMSLDASGNLITLGDITAFGTP